MMGAEALESICLTGLQMVMGQTVSKYFIEQEGISLHCYSG